MSSENEEIVSVKSDKDLISKPRDSNVEKIIPAKSSKDQVDHAVMSTGPQIDQSEPSVSVSKTDSGFNDPGTAPKDTDVDVDSSDDEDLHLQWDDDETDEQELLSAKNTKKTESGKVEADIVEDESLDENLLLESSDEAEKNNDLVTKDDESNLEKDTELAESDVEELLNSDNDTEIQPKLTTSDVSDKNIDKDIPIPTPKEAKKTESEEVTNKSKAKNEAAKEMGNVQDESLINNSGPTTSSPNESFCNTSLEANADSGFKKPDVMLEIPTQEIIDILDDTDISITCTNDGDIEMETKDEPNKAMVINEKSDKSESGKSENNEKEEIAIELNPTVTFEIDSNKPNDSESTNIQPVSEDDWSEIERRLENFETSLVGESEVKEGDKEKTNVGIEASVASTQNKPIEEGHSKSNSSPTESKEDDLKPKPDPEFEVKKISMTELMKTMVASEATTESSVVCQSLPVTAVDNSIIEASAQALSLSSNKKMVVSGVTMEVRKDDLNIRKDLQVHPPIPIEKLLTSEQGIEESTSPDMGTELPVVEKMDVDPSILDIDVKPVDLDGNTSMDLDDDQNAEALEITEEDYKEEDTKKSDIEINSNTESKETFKTSLEEIKTTEIESTVNIAKISEESNIEVDPPIQSTKESSESQLQKEKILETSPVTLISENVQTSPKSLSKVTVSKVSETAKTLVGKEITVKSSSKLDTTVSELEKSPTKRVEASLNKKDSANRTSKVNMEAENNSTDISTDVNSSKPTPDLASELPSTSKAVVNPVIEVSEQPSTSKLVTEEIKPSTKTSKPSNSPTDDTKLSEAVHPSPAEPSQSLDTDDIAEVTDSLGLLAESSRTMEDDEEPEEFEEDDDDFYPDDESSNQMTAEHSEDSNQQNSETEAQKEAEEKETEVESPQEEKGQGEFDLGEGYGAVEKDEDTNMSEIVCEEESHEIAEKAVESLDVEKTSEAKEEKQDLVDKPEMETVRLSDTSDEEGKADASTSDGLPNKETTDAKATKTDELAEKISPKKTLEVTKQNDVMSFVDLEESSSEDDVQEVKKEAVNPAPEKKSEPIEGAHIPEEIEVTPVVEDKVEEIVSTTADKKVTEIPESKDTDAPEVKTDDQTQPKHKFGLEIFNLDSDEEEPVAKPPPVLPIETRDAGGGAEADASAATAILVNGIKDLTPLLDMHMGSKCSDLVEISDSETDDDEGDSAAPREPIGHVAARFIEAELAKTFNETWLKYKMDSRLGEAEDTLSKEMLKLEEETKEIDAMLSECQAATDRLRNELYATFEQNRQELNPLIIYDTPSHKYICSESAVMQQESPVETRAKRRMSSASESSAKRAAIPMGYTPLDNSDSKWGEPTVENTKADDDKDISVLQVSAESAPADLPPPGELIRPPLRVDDAVYAMRNSFGTWAKARVLEVQPKGQGVGGNQNFTVCRVKLVSRTMHKAKLLPARWLAYSEPANVRMTIGTRLIALFKDPLNRYQKETFYSGIVAEVPNPVNNYRYLVFFDDGYAQYVRHRDTRPVCECSALVWEEVHPFSREFVRKYLIAYPERPMVRLHAGQTINTELNGKWLPSRVNRVDASLVQVMFEMDGRTEWIYRGSTRLAPLYKELQAAERRRARPMPRTKVHPKMNMPYVEYTRSEEQGRGETIVQHAPSFEREIRQRAVAKKSTSAPPVVPAPTTSESVTSRVVYYTPKNSVKPYKMSPHTCGPHCKRTDTFTLKELRTYNPLAKPLLSGWERQIVRYNGCKEVMYRAPCGRRLRCVRELHRYLRAVHSDMPVDLFDFTPATHCLAEFVLNKCLVGKKDLSHGKENVPVPCVNYYDDSLPEFCSYNTERTPTAGVPLNLDPEFLCGCDCTDDCEDKSKCACWKMTLEGARTIGLRGARVGYAFRRLPEPLPSGIYECNSRCKCKQTCLNRVAQQPLQLKLQVFKTLNRGWGIRALNDVPKGSFLCVYAGNLLTDATANMDGLNEGDEYLAELDYIEVVEQMKEGYEEDVPEEDKKLDKKNVVQAEDAESSSSEEEGAPSKNEMDDGDFCPGHIGVRVTQFSKRLRKRGKNKKEKDDGAKEKGATKEKATAKDGDKPEDDCITISDDEEVREPSRFMAQDGMESQEFVSKYKSVRTLFGKDEACYIMDAKVQGNIGRYLNHSCMPNVFVQNVFVDTHDPRFPWVAFFALSHIKAGTELTWNYNYDVGSVPGKTLYCYCGAPNCRGRLL